MCWWNDDEHHDAVETLECGLHSLAVNKAKEYWYFSIGVMAQRDLDLDIIS